MSEQERKIKHPSFGMISISKGSCSEHMNLFGSSILQRSFVRIDITRAFLIRNLNQDSIFPEGFQVLCYNCNCGRARNGGICPHKVVN